MKPNDLKIALKKAAQAIEQHEMPDEKDVQLLEEHYGKALANSPCPCGSDKEFRQCCKYEYLMVHRTVKGMKDQHKQARKDQVREAQEQEDVEKSILWYFRIGLDKRGVVRVEPLDEGVQLHEVMIMLLRAHQGLFMEVMQGVVDQKLGALAKAMGMRRGGGSGPGIIGI